MHRRLFVLTALARRLAGVSSPLKLRSVRTSDAILVRPYTSDVAVAVEMFVQADYDDVKLLFTPPASILDLGANIGLSVRLWQTWFPSAQIVALEPNPATLNIARQNIAIGRGTQSVMLVHAAVGYESSTVSLAIDDQPWANRVVQDANAETIEVPSMTMIDCLDLFPTPTIGLCKCDIEGGEAVLFQSCHAWIHRIESLVVETHAPYDVDKLIEDLARNGSSLVLRRKVQRGDFWLAFFCTDQALRPTT